MGKLISRVRAQQERAEKNRELGETAAAVVVAAIALAAFKNAEERARRSRRWWQRLRVF